jgi:hypothetical protein
MYVQMQTIDGQVFASDPVDWDKPRPEPVEVDEAIAGIEEVFSAWRDANHVAIEIGGRKRFFNPLTSSGRKSSTDVRRD